MDDWEYMKHKSGLVTHSGDGTMLLHQLLDFAWLHERRDTAQVNHTTFPQGLVVAVNLALTQRLERSLHCLPGYICVDAMIDIFTLSIRHT